MKKRHFMATHTWVSDDVRDQVLAANSQMSDTELQKFTNGVSNLRDGKGAIYIKSAGNGFNTSQDVNEFGLSCGDGVYDGVFSCTEQHIDNRSTIPYVIIVGALGADEYKSSYTTPGAATWVSGFGGEYGYDASIYNGVSGNSTETAMMTVDRSSCSLGYSRTGNSSVYGRNKFNLAGQNYSDQTTLNSSCNYNSHFNGTSAAAPTVAGVVALMLEANPDLTWRDVKHILASTSDKVNPDVNHVYNSSTLYAWTQNSAGYEFNNMYGFGKVNAAEAVALAQTYTANSLGDFVTSGRIEKIWNDGAGTAIPRTLGASTGLNVTKPEGSNGVVEFVRVSIAFEHQATPYIGFRLLSPNDTTLSIVQPITNVTSNGVYFDIGVSGFYGEDMEGTWYLRVDDHLQDANYTGTLYKWSIEVYGN